MNYIANLTTIECLECYRGFAVDSQWRDDGKGYKCPYCRCSMVRAERTEVEKLQNELAVTNRSLSIARSDARYEKKKAAAFKGQVTKIKKRTSAGVCPCCNRTFKQLAAHMKSNHPDYV